MGIAMKKKYVFVVCLLLSITLLSMGVTTLYVHLTQETKEGEFTVVTSFYPMYIATLNLTEQIPGVSLKNLSEPQTGCLHDFQLTPEDMRLLSTADVFVINGGGVESFLEEVAKAYPNLTIVTACEYVELLQDEEEANGHAWMEPGRYMDMVDAIADGLSGADETHRKLYEEHAGEYKEKLSLLCRKLDDLKPRYQGEKVILLHEAFAYLAEALGMQVEYVLDLDEERQISAGEVAQVVQLIEDENISVLFVEERYGKEMAETLQKETGVRICYLDPLNRGEYEPDSYLNVMGENLKLLQ